MGVRGCVLMLSLALLSVAALHAEMGLINVSAASLRNEASHSSELETQVSYGTPIEILDDGGTWLRVRTPDGYVAYAHDSHVCRKTAEEMSAWRMSDRVIVTSLYPTVIYSDSLEQSPENVVSDAALGCIFEGNKLPGSSYVSVTLPDGRKGVLPAADVEMFRDWMTRPANPSRMLDVAYSLTGVPYLWGGATPKGVDCSGLTQLVYFDSGLLIPRNASQQAETGESLDVSFPDLFQKGDLLFFGEGDGTKITHVAIYDGNARFVHASGRVSLASFNVEDPLYVPRKVLKAVRLISAFVDPEQFSVLSHPWYF